MVVIVKRKPQRKFGTRSALQAVLWGKPLKLVLTPAVKHALARVQHPVSKTWRDIAQAATGPEGAERRAARKLRQLKEFMGDKFLNRYVTELAIFDLFPEEELDLTQMVIKSAVRNHTFTSLVGIMFSSQDRCGQGTGKSAADDFEAFSACFHGDVTNTVFREWVMQTFTPVLQRLMEQYKSIPNPCSVIQPPGDLNSS